MTLREYMATLDDPEERKRIQAGHLARLHDDDWPASFYEEVGDEIERRPLGNAGIRRGT